MDKFSLSNCVFVKTILMISVIFGHSCAFWSGDWFTCNPMIQSPGLHFLYSWIGSIHIFAFAMVSGYIFAYKMSKGDYRLYLTFLKGKAKRLLIPYCFVMCVWVAPIAGLLLKWDYIELFRRYILCIDPNQLWFLWMLFGVFAIMHPLWKTLDDHPYLGWFFCLTFYTIGILGKRLLPNVFCIWSVFQYIPLFYLGIRLYSYKRDQRENVVFRVPIYSWVFFHLALFFASFAFSKIPGFFFSLISVGTHLMLHIVGALMAFYILQHLAELFRWRESRFFNTLSVYSMPMYLFHQQIIYFVIVLLNGKVNPWINAGANFVVAIVGSFLISAFLMHWKVTRILIGEN